MTQLELRHAAGEPEEEVLEARVAGGELVPQLGHGAAGDDLAALDDADAVAHVLGDLERVRAHEDGAAALR